MTSASPPPSISVESSPSGAAVRLGGSWVISEAAALEARVGTPPPPGTGPVEVDASGITTLDTAGALVLFQRGALFGSLTVCENVALPLREHTNLGDLLIEELAMLKIALVGLPPDAAAKTPSQLSGGMVKRAGLARALALDPELLLLDEPTSGLDPVGARALGRLILDLQRALGLTVVLVTHDPDAVRILADRVAMLGRGNLLAIGTVQELESSPDTDVREYFQAGLPMRKEA